MTLTLLVTETLQASMQMLATFFGLNLLLICCYIVKLCLVTPKFFENRCRDIAVDPDFISSRLRATTQQSSLISVVDSQGSASATSTGIGLVEMLSAIQDWLFQSAAATSNGDPATIQEEEEEESSLESESIMSLESETLQIEQMFGCGYMGTIYKVKPCAATASTTALVPGGSRCIKHIDLKRLRKIIEDINGIDSAVVTGLASMFQPTAEVKRALMISKYAHHYRQFVATCHKLDRCRDQNRHILFYEHVVTYRGEYQAGGTAAGPNQRQNHHHQPTNAGGRPRKMFHKITDADPGSELALPNVVLLVMPLAALNLRLAIIEMENELPLATVIEWSRQLLDGLAFLHRLRIGHLNLKPENILLFEKSEVEETQRPSPLPTAKGLPPHHYYVRIGDAGCGGLLPTACQMLTTGHRDTIYTILPVVHDKLTERFEDIICYDLYCFGITLLIMLLGYERFERRFVVNHFPHRLISHVRYGLMSAVRMAAADDQADEQHQRRRIPKQFVDVLQMIFDSKHGVNAETVAKHPAFLNH